MRLKEYLMLYKSVDFDVPDNEIDNVVVVCWDKEHADEISKDFPYMDKFTEKLLSLVEIDYCRRDGCPICKFSDIILKNKAAFLKFAKKEWTEDYYNYVKDDDVELCYQFIKEFDNVVGGRYGESMNKQYFKLIESIEQKGVDISGMTVADFFDDNPEIVSVRIKELAPAVVEEIKNNL